MPNHSSSSNEKSSNNLPQFALAIVLVTLVAVLVGWCVGSYLEKSSPRTFQGNEKENVHDREKPSGPESLSLLANVIKLPTLLVNLAQPSTKRIRLDVSLVIKEGEKLPVEVSADITSDFLLFLRTATFAQLKGPTGIFYLRQDLLDRARIRSNGKVTAILITSLVLE